MSQNRTEDWVHIQTPKTENLIASPSYIRKLLNLPFSTTTDISNIFARLNNLERYMDILAKPIRQKEILDFMATLDRPRTWGYIQGHKPTTDWFDFHDLVNSKKIVRVPTRLYKLGESASEK